MARPSKIEIKKTPEQVELIRKMGSKNKLESMAAQEAFASAIAPVILAVVEQAPVISNLYSNRPFAEGTAPSVPLDVLFDIRDRNFIQVTTQSQAGGLPTNFVHGLDELFLSVYELDSAVAMYKKYARDARLDVVAALLLRMAQEILVRQEINGASILMNALATATGQTTGKPQINAATNAGYFNLNDLNRLIILAARSRPSWVGGTPVGGQAITDLLGSPEFFGQIRAMSYQPVNTTFPYVGATGSGVAGAAIAASDDVRKEVWKTSGLASLFGINLTEVYEMGKGKSYDTLFSNFFSTTQFDGSNTYTAGTNEIVVGLNLNEANVLVRVIEEGEAGTLSVIPDDQFSIRTGKLGFSASVREGRAMLDSRAICGVAL